MSTRIDYHTQINMIAPVENATDVANKKYVDDGLAAKADASAATGISAHVANKANPHSVTPAQIGAATTAVATASVNGLMAKTDKSKLDGIAAGAQVNTVTSVAGKTGAVTLTAADVGLGNVNNTTDAAKPVSSATQTALNAKANLASPTFTGAPKAPTAAAGTSTTQLASTAFVQAALGTIKAPKMYTGTITGNGTAKTFALTHNLGTTSVIIQARDASNNTCVFGTSALTTTAVTLCAAVAPANGEKFTVTIMGVVA